MLRPHKFLQSKSFLLDKHSADNRYTDDYNHNRNNHHHHRKFLNISNESLSQRGSETEDFSESDCEKDIDICDDDNKVTSSSVETPVSVKDFEDDDTCSAGGGRSTPGVSSPGPEDSAPPAKNRSSKKSSKSQKRVEMKGRCNCDGN